MPELPEVETIVRGLRKEMRHLEFSKIEVHLKKSLRGYPGSFIASLKGRRILDLERRGKNIIFRLNGGVVLGIHLRMTGRLRFVSAPAPLEKHTHVVFSFQGHCGQLRFVDQRQFGRLWVEKGQSLDDPDSLGDLGPDPLQISAPEFLSRMHGKRRAIKPLLLDQRFLAGIGNIYADEALHRARVHPRERADQLPDKTILRLFDNLQELLRQAIRAGGTSVRTYVDAYGSAGGFQKLLRVYGRKGEPCLVCGTRIVRERLGGRGTFFCPRCQSWKGAAKADSENRTGRRNAGKDVA